MLCTNICVVNKLARKVENDKLCGKNPQHKNNIIEADEKTQDKDVSLTTTTITLTP